MSHYIGDDCPGGHRDQVEKMEATIREQAADLAAAIEALARVRGTVERLDRESAAIHLGELERNVAHYCIDALRSALLDADPRDAGEGGPCAACGTPFNARAVDVAWTSGRHDIGAAECPRCSFPALVKLDPPALTKETPPHD